MTPDPYKLDASQIAAPPTSFFGRLRYLGPGLVLTASIVGSGELIATTALGAQAGFTALWVILLSCLVKVALQLEFGRHAIQTGQTCLKSFQQLPGLKLGGVHWTTCFWLAVQPLKILQVGGIVGGTGMILHKAMPALSVLAWGALAAASAAVLVARDRYRLIERGCVAMILAFTATTVASVAALQWTRYAVTLSDLAAGFRLQLPSGAGRSAIAILIAAFGLTGVGGDEIMQYTYWLIEKGYAAKAGPRIAGDAAWAARARGWIRVMYLDALLSMVVYTVVTAGFYILGAAVLHARGEVPQGYAMIDTLSAMYTESLGPWAWRVFLVGALVVLYSTLFSALAAWTRIFTDAAGVLGIIDFANPASRRKSIVFLAWTFPALWVLLFATIGEPVFMVKIGGIATASILLVVVVAAIHYRTRDTAAELNPGRLYDFALGTSIALLAAFACYTAYATFA